MRNHKLGKLQVAALKFAKKYPGWHTYAKDSTTTRVIDSLQAKKLIDTNQYRQFRLAN